MLLLVFRVVVRTDPRMPSRKIKVVTKAEAKKVTAAKAKAATLAAAAKKAPQPKPKRKKTPWAGLLVKRPKNFAIGCDVQPKRDLRRFMKWPKYVVLQRKKQILAKRIKIPAPIAQFSRTAEKSLQSTVFKLLEKHKLLTDKEKKQELQKLATDKKAVKKPKGLKPGIKEVFKSIEQKKAKLVVIAHDVDPIELVLVLPGLCRKMGVPYVIVKGKARLGIYVHRKKCIALAVTGATTNELKPILEGIKAQPDDWNQIGGGTLGRKTMAKLAKKEKARKALKNEKLGALLSGQ